MKKTLLTIGAMIAFITGCNNGIDYVVHAPGGGETIYEEVIVEVIVEVPVYIEIEVPGETEYGEIWVDSFDQPQSVDGVDILWIIDTSGSMHRWDAQLMAGIEAMLEALPESGWRLAMLSNDPTQAATEAQFPLVPGDDIDDAMDMYNAMGRGGREEGFDAAYEYIINNSYAATWMRPDAALLVVMVSDEEEQSDAHFPDIADFKSWYASQRGGSAYLASINNVEQTDSVCASPVNPTDIGYRYMEATNFFSGVVVDICEEDWAPGVTDASARLEPYESLQLTYVVSDESTIRVFTNGVLTSPWDWYYQSSDNTVYFNVIPAGNDHVEIAYHYDPDDPYGTGSGTDTGDTGA
jgi:hypothetical protein